MTAHTAAGYCIRAALCTFGTTRIFSIPKPYARECQRQDSKTLLMVPSWAVRCTNISEYTSGTRTPSEQDRVVVSLYHHLLPQKGRTLHLGKQQRSLVHRTDWTAKEGACGWFPQEMGLFRLLLREKSRVNVALTSTSTHGQTFRLHMLASICKEYRAALQAARESGLLSSPVAMAHYMWGLCGYFPGTFCPNLFRG